VDNSQYAELFLTESREHVAAINSSLLELEREVGGPGAAAAVSAIFRSVHTIKGMSATMGYTGVADLSHQLETVLDRVRSDRLKIDSELMDLLFHSADVLEKAIEAAVAGRPDVEANELVGSLRALTAAESTARAKSPLWSPAISATEGTLVRVQLAADTPLAGVRAFMIVQAVGRVGTVSSVVPPLDELQGEGFDGHITFHLATSADAAEIERTIRAMGDVASVSIAGHDTDPRAEPTGGESGFTAEFEISSAAMAAAPKPVKTGREARNIRIDLRRLDNMMNLVGELVVARGRLSQLASELGDQTLEDTVNDASRLISDLRDEITASRMVPVWQVFDRFPRTVRDAARALGKRVEFTIEGNDIELDRSMLDEIGGAIVHLLRNAVDHGIETPAEREAAGKPPIGRLGLSAVRDRSAVVIKVSDDGRGINRDRVLARAKADGLVEMTKTVLTEDELLRLLARPGFSTAETVTNLSGRGVGVDAAYTRVRALGGAMDIRSVPGQGTTMVMRLPQTLAIVRALLARVGNETYAIPLAHVSETIELTPGIVRTVKGKEVLMERHDVLPLLRLRSLVGLPPYKAAAAIELEHVVVIDLGDRRAGLVIDELTGQEEIVVKQYDAVRDGLPFFGGATLLGDGRPSLIVDVSSLL